MGGDRYKDFSDGFKLDDDSVSQRLLDSLQRNRELKDSNKQKEPDSKSSQPAKGDEAKPGVDISNGLVSRVTYPDGSTREFAYQGKELVQVTQPNSIVWKKDGNAWVSTDRHRFEGTISVSPDGTYAFLAPDRKIHVIKADGDKSLIDATPIAELHAEIKQHNDWEDNQSYLKRGIQEATTWFTGERKTFQEAQQVDTAAQQALQGFDLAKIQKLSAQIPSLLNQEHGALVQQDNLDYFGSSGLRIASVLLPGKGALPAAVAWGSDAANPSAGAGKQILQAAVGAAAGANIAYAYDKSMAAEAYTVGTAATFGARALFTGVLPFAMARDWYTIKDPAQLLRNPPAPESK